MFDEYCASLDAGIAEKWRLITPWIPRSDSGDIVDVGSGTGTLAAMLKRAHPRHGLIAIDHDARMVSAARRRHGAGRNLSFRLDDAARVHSTKAVAVVLSSVLHEVYSDHGDSLAAVLAALRSARASLAPGGRIIIRDFVRPGDAGREVIFRHSNRDIVHPHDFESFLKSFRRSAHIQGVWPGALWTSYRTDLGTALEFLLRKDFHSSWGAQLREHYAFWTLEDAMRLVARAGLRLIFHRLFSSQWLLRARWLGKVELLDPETLNPLPYPAQQLLLVAESLQAWMAPAPTASKPAGHRVEESYTAPWTLAPVRSAPVRSAPLRMEFASDASLSTAPVKKAPLSPALLISARKKSVPRASTRLQ